ncbi:TonB family C-terminal domain-containing protein [Sphingomonas laterariae]|uniref:TonB family C-terminal domain-containing protein n=1 Tax=Edaphosphingomonas laterariae TaxID=861865 RepID=A0A239HIE6_9SPHN|nr:energy transducer TonB [Sphingomonas laterariae]SNS81090.1 TonB family C-terminal domain-containing protein [Sphingomonas laterariae]
MLRRLCLGILGVAMAGPALAADPANLYPAVVIDKATLSYTDDGRGGIARCRAIVSTESERRDWRACDELRNRGIPRDVIPARPVAGPALVTPADYPELAVKRGESGTAEAIVEVDETGKPSACWISYSSGSPRLDQQSCQLLLTRARYSPATYKGQPVRAIGVRDVVWPKR